MLKRILEDVIKLETVDIDSTRRNKSASNLKFPKVTKISGTSEKTPDDSRDRDRRNFQDIHLDLVDKADKIQADQQNINQRVQANQKIEAPTKFKNFSRQQQFTSSGKGSNPAKHSADGASI